MDEDDENDLAKLIRELDRKLADLALQEAHTSALRDSTRELREVSLEIKRYTARQEVAPAELMARARALIETAEWLGS